MNKNECVRATRRETLKRHSSMKCAVFEVRVVSSKMNRLQRIQVNGLFREAKLIRNVFIQDRSKKKRVLKVCLDFLGEYFCQNYNYLASAGGVVNNG